MQQYTYTAVNLQKEKFKGHFIAKDENDLAVQLSKQGLYLTSCKVYTGKTPSAFFTMGTGKVSLQELTNFCRQFAIMINAGISILGCLDILKEQHFSSYFKSILQVIDDDVKAGVMFSDALEKHKKVFPDFFRSMIKVGEVSGKLDMVLNSLADYYEKDTQLRKKAKSAFAYPIVLGIMTVALVVLMLMFVVPKFRDALSNLDVEATGLTATIYAVSDFLIEYGLFVFAIIMLIVIGIFGFTKTKKGSYLWDKFKLICPIVKQVQIDTVTSKFARGFALLLSSGMDITEAMNAILIVLGNKDIIKRFKQATDDVKHGVGIAVAFDKYDLFPPIMLQMISVGEQTASLDEVLTRACSFFDDKVEATITSIVNKIQPTMLIIMGAAVGTMFVAVYAPMISIMGAF